MLRGRRVVHEAITLLDCATDEVVGHVLQVGGQEALHLFDHRLRRRIERHFALRRLHIRQQFAQQLNCTIKATSTETER